jgi:dTDP-glucose pyrophosphorylase
MTEINVLIPMAGEGSRFSKAGFSLPKPFISVNGKPMIQWVFENLSCPDVSVNFICVLRTEHDRNFNIKSHLEALDGRIHVIYAEKLTEGAASTCLLAKDLINNDVPLVIANSDQFIEWDASKFYADVLSSGRDGTILCFNLPMELNDTKWSYAAVNVQGNVLDVQEKKVISPHATVGVYVWNKGRDFVRSAEEMIRKNVRVNGEFYVAPVYNEGIAEGATYKLHHCKRMWGLGTPEDLEYFEINHLGKPRESVVQRTYDYVAAFNSRNLDAIHGLMSPGFELTDGNGKFISRSSCCEYIKSLFDNKELILDVKNVISMGSTSVIEFSTLIGGKEAKGVDVIEWSKDPVMKCMRAYVYFP